MNEKLSMREKIAYGTGGFANNLIADMIIVYLLFFYTDIYGIPAGVAGTMFIVVRVIDAFTDMAMGMIVDRTSTKYGKLRPWILIGAIPFGVMAVLCFVTPPLNEVGKIVYAYVTYNLLSIAMTMVIIPYSSLPAVMTQDTKEVVSLNVFRNVFGTIGSICVTVIVPILAPLFGGGNMRKGYPLAMLVFAVISSLLFINVFANSKERYTVKEKKKKEPLMKSLKILFSNKILLLLTLMIAIAVGSTNLRATSIAYYFTYYMERTDMMGYYFVIVYGSIIAGMPIVTFLNRFIGRKQLFAIDITIFIAAQGSLFFIPKTSYVIFWVLSIIAGLATSGVTVLVSSLLPDAVEYGEYKTGQRTEGTIFAFSSFANKVAMAAGGAIPAIVLELTGYVPGGVQNAATLNGVNMLMTIIPAGLLVLVLVVLKFYPVDENKFQYYLEENQKRRMETEQKDTEVSGM